MHLKRGENPFQSSKRTESDRRQRDFDKAWSGTFQFSPAQQHRSQKLAFLKFNLTTLCFQESDFNGNAFLSFCGLQYTGVETLGKELFMYFGSRALRYYYLHISNTKWNWAINKKYNKHKGHIEILIWLKWADNSMLLAWWCPQYWSKAFTLSLWSLLIEAYIHIH